MEQEITFGKYKGKTLEELSKDQQYSKWLITQPWFKIKFKEQYKLLCEKISEGTKYEIDKNSIIIYTDGACSNNGLSKNVRGGCGIYFSRENKVKMEDISVKLKEAYELFQGFEKYREEKDTNNKAELMAILLALRRCIQSNIKEKIIIYTDSEYSMKSITLWFPEWERKGNKDKKQNIEIIERIRECMKYLNVRYEYIRAHTDLTDKHS